MVVHLDDLCVAVVGGGVNGLTSALLLAQSGARVTIFTDSITNVSEVAAAFWYPYLVEPRARSIKWANLSYDVFRSLAEQPSSGVSVLGAQILDNVAVDRDVLTHAEKLDKGCFTPPQNRQIFADRFCVLLPVIEMPVYLQFLREKLSRLNVETVRRKIASIDELVPSFKTVLNCSGLGARELVGDETLFGVRGQLCHYEGPIRESYQFLVDFSSGCQPTYIVPRGSSYVLGGTAITSEDEALSAVDSCDIFDRCASFYPELNRDSISKAIVGIRPCRPSVRCEYELVNGAHVVHNYGHGGAGVTLSWGCAYEVLSLIANTVSA